MPLKVNASLASHHTARQITTRSRQHPVISISADQLSYTSPPRLVTPSSTSYEALSISFDVPSTIPPHQRRDPSQANKFANTLRSNPVLLLCARKQRNVLSHLHITQTASTHTIHKYAEHAVGGSYGP
ncbi:hypothetical protein LTR28_009100 [Elasticomyces elasticus]|nr:hypothetical protein LTR28_009100 [Elasticomyces elasticus]